jgi:zinc/manganese transport system substrate-binding protein
MKNLTLVGWLLLGMSSPLHAGLRIFACEPEWGALAEALAGSEAHVYVATTAQQDVHHIQARPSLIAQVRRADLVVCTGAELEVGWLPMLLRRGNNSRVLPGSPGYFMAADHINVLAKPVVLDRSEGDVHPYGNPHIHLDPRNYPPIARALVKRMQELDADNSDAYQSRGEAFLSRWQAALEDWQHRAKPLKGLRTVVYHDGWIYLNAWLGLQQVAVLEPKPGIPPTSGHLSGVLKLMEADPARVIIRAPYQNARAADWLHQQTGIPIRVLPYTVGGNPDAEDLFGLFDSTLELLSQVTQ